MLKQKKSFRTCGVIYRGSDSNKLFLLKELVLAGSLTKTSLALSTGTNNWYKKTWYLTII